MINAVIVAGKSVEQVVNNLDGKEIEVETYFNKVDELWEDIMNRGSAAYADVDKIVIIANGLLSEQIMSHQEQILNIQSVMGLKELRSDLYIVVKDSDLYDQIRRGGENTLIYRNFNMLVFDELNVKVVTDVIKGLFDAKGIYHPDFLKKDEMDELLNQAFLESETEFIPMERTTGREIDTDVYIDLEAVEEERRLLEQQEALAAKEREQAEREREQAERQAAKEREIAERQAAKEREIAERQEAKEREQAERQRLLELRKSKAETKRKPTKIKHTHRRNSPPVPAPRHVSKLQGVYALTGDRQSGVSTTTANLAATLVKTGHNVLIMDLDTSRRFQSRFFPKFESDVELDNRIGNGIYVALANPKNLEDVSAVVEPNLSVLGLSQYTDRYARRFANRDIDDLFTDSNLISLLSYAKSFYDVILIDVPLAQMYKIGSFLSYVDNVLLCMPNTEYSLDNIFEVEMPNLMLKHDLVGHTLLSKSKIVLTKYLSTSQIAGKEATPSTVETLLYGIDDPMYHVEVLSEVPFSEDYEKQFIKNKPIALADNEFYNSYIQLISKLTPQ